MMIRASTHTKQRPALLGYAACPKRNVVGKCTTHTRHGDTCTAALLVRQKRVLGAVAGAKQTAIHVKHTIAAAVHISALPVVVSTH